ncbi:hypothetical protein PRUB_a0548 [Pseudoalteromonas rubra]|uniref:Uncharacterized protein n=1 Tax=Pseudoalteromonas rubra TaxID=43658 RepID=A0A8T0C7R4_9GAMM|nr:hypothetical protein PRUB_a0548 [Pseudoalteromonas rubra]
MLSQNPVYCPFISITPFAENTDFTTLHLNIVIFKTVTSGLSADKLAFDLLKRYYDNSVHMALFTAIFPT